MYKGGIFTKIVTTHIKSDFDAISSSFAFKKLNPEYEVVIDGLMNGNTNKFLSMFNNYFRPLRYKDVKNEKIEEIVIVDTNSSKRIGNMKKFLANTPYRVIDHHPLELSDLDKEKILINNYGANVTYFIKEMQSKEIKPTPIEATLFILGIYEDTGRLSFDSTTVDDIKSAAYLLECGADLSVISEFLKYEIDYDLKDILNQFLENAMDYYIKDSKITITKAISDDFVWGVAPLVSNLMDLLGKETIIALVEMNNMVQGIMRSNSDRINVGEFCKIFGGGGQKHAGSFVIRNVKRFSRLEDDLIKALKKTLKDQLTAKDLMSYPVKVVPHDMKIEKVYDIISRTGYSAFPVVEDDKIIGMITRVDVDKAMRHGYMDKPVKGYFRKKVVAVDKDAPLSQIKDYFLNKGIEALPVIDKGILCGIITKTDLLRRYHKGFKLFSKKIEPIIDLARIEEFTMDVKHLMFERIPKKFLHLLLLLGYIGDEIGLPIFVVGGFVRDLIMGIPNFDIDIVVERDGLAFAREIKKHFDVELFIHKKFKTAVVKFPDGFKIDVTTARTEYYGSPATLPEVEEATIKKDLYRRDFTINAMAIELNNSNFGQLLDFFEGLKDIKNKKVRILHNLSFVEDPTRILRAIRFEQRYGFKLDDITEKLLRKAIKENLISKVSQFRVKEEMINIFSEPDPSLAIGRFLEFNLIEQLFPNVNPSKDIINYYKRAVKFVETATANLHSVYRPAVFLPILLYDLEIPELDIIEARYGFSKQLKKIFKELVMEKDVFEDKFTMDFVKRSDIWEAFHKLSIETAIVLVTMQNDEKIDDYFELYLSDISKIKLEYINGKVLESLGYKKGRKLGKILKDILKEKIDGKIDNELTYISTKLLPFVEEDALERIRRRLEENSIFKEGYRKS